jgi:hypothetical protein
MRKAELDVLGAAPAEGGQDEAGRLRPHLSVGRNNRHAARRQRNPVNLWTIER